MRKTPLTERDHRYLAHLLKEQEQSIKSMLARLYKALPVNGSEVRAAERIRNDLLKLRLQLESVAADTLEKWSMYWN
jgi:hypothetical protein